MLGKGILRAREYLDKSGHSSPKAHLIIISPQHVVMVELIGKTARHTQALPLLTNSSAKERSPGFRDLSSVLTSECWKTSNFTKERWPYSIPSEVLLGILHALEPRDEVAFAQASSRVERWYYDLVPQLRALSVQTRDLSIPCCGKCTGLDDSGIYCFTCYIWQHQRCDGLQALASDKPYICSHCLAGDKNSTEPTPGGISRFDRRKDRKPYPVLVDGSSKLLHGSSILPLFCQRLSSSTFGSMELSQGQCMGLMICLLVEALDGDQAADWPVKISDVVTVYFIIDMRMFC